MKTFWILWNPEGKTPPTVTFSTVQAAMIAAEKLQTRIGVGTMYVMKCVASLTVKQLAEWNNGKKK